MQHKRHNDCKYD